MSNPSMPLCAEVAGDVKTILLDVPFGDAGGIHYIEYLDRNGERKQHCCRMWPWITDYDFNYVAFFGCLSRARPSEFAARSMAHSTHDRAAALEYYALQSQLDSLTGFRLDGFPTRYTDYIKLHPIPDPPRPRRRLWNCLKAIGRCFIEPFWIP